MSLLELEEPCCLLFSGDIVCKFSRGRAATFRIIEHIEAVVSHLLNQLHGLAKVVNRFSWESNNDIAGDRHLTPRVLHCFNSFQVVGGCVSAAHSAQDSIAARLNGKMNPVAEIFVLVYRGHNVRMKVAWE